VHVYVWEHVLVSVHMCACTYIFLCACDCFHKALCVPMTISLCMPCDSP
jgi:hypothetical protein